MTKRRDYDGSIARGSETVVILLIVFFRIFPDMRRSSSCLFHALPSARERPLSRILALEWGESYRVVAKLYTILLGIFFSSIQINSILFTCCQHRYGIVMNTYKYTYTYTDTYRQLLYILVQRASFFLSYIFSESIMLSARDGAWGRFTHICEYIIDFIEVHTCLL